MRVLVFIYHSKKRYEEEIREGCPEKISGEDICARYKRALTRKKRQMFTGTYTISADSKNRIFIPAKYRDQLAGQCMLSRGFDKCLYIYSMEEWNILTEKIKKLKQSDRDVRKFIREFFSNSEECHLDSQGRILIPAKLKEYAGITKNIVAKGAMDKIELWSEEVLGDPDAENMMDNDEFVAKLDMYDL